jgi:hypothetical protein
VKPLITPPTRELMRLRGSCLMLDNEHLVTAWQVIDEVAGEYRYRYAISADVKRDLLRLAALVGCPVFVGTYLGKPFFGFPRPLADGWLKNGGRNWIIAELETRSTRRVVAFPGRHS